ncbi:hypothetical protein PAPHI01_2451 [Pancytospora philotis]|nr:hypothetical protein PAPHI01_2451 [Pancytospora philotis]
MAPRNVEETEKLLVGRKNWRHAGEIKASSRPQNSLLHENVEFDTTIFNVPISAALNSEIAKYVAQRFKEKTFDNYHFEEMKEKIEKETYDFELCETNKEILALYEDIESALKKITDYGNDGFS